MTSNSPSPGPGAGPSNRHALSAIEKQKMQLEKLLKDPSKPAYIPPAPKEKTIRPPREMMKNVQGSSAGAGSGEFHVYKAARRREYERIKIMDEMVQKEVTQKEFEDKKRKWEEEADAKTAKNRARRIKKKERNKGKGKGDRDESSNRNDAESGSKNSGPLKKKRIIGGDGKELVFHLGGNGEDESDEEAPGPREDHSRSGEQEFPVESLHVAETAKIIIHEDD